MRFLSQDPVHKAKVHKTIGVVNTWGSRTGTASASSKDCSDANQGKSAHGTCSTLPTLPMKRGPDEGNTAGSKDCRPRFGARRHRSGGTAKRQSTELELEVMPPEEQDLPFLVRQAKSARNY